MEHRSYLWSGENQDKHVQDWLSDTIIKPDRRRFIHAQVVNWVDGIPRIEWIEVDATCYADMK